MEYEDKHQQQQQQHKQRYPLRVLLLLGQEDVKNKGEKPFGGDQGWYTTRDGFRTTVNYKLSLMNFRCISAIGSLALSWWAICDVHLSTFCANYVVTYRARIGANINSINAPPTSHILFSGAAIRPRTFVPLLWLLEPMVWAKRQTDRTCSATLCAVVISI